MNLYERAFLTEGRGEPGYDIPVYSIYAVRFNYLGRSFRSEVRDSSLSIDRAKRAGIAAALRQQGITSNKAIGLAISLIQRNPRY